MRSSRSGSSRSVDLADAAGGPGRRRRPQHRRHQQHEAAEPHAHPRQVDQVGHDRQRDQVARDGVAGEGHGHEQRQSAGRGHDPGRARSESGQPRDDHRRHGQQDQAHHPRAPRACAELVGDDVGRQDVAQRAAGGVGALQRDAQHRGDHAHRPGRRHDAPGPAVAGTAGPEPGEEHDRPHEHGEAAEGEEPHDPVDGPEGVVAVLRSAEHVVDEGLVVDGHAPRRADPERERPADRVAVGGHHSPGDDVGRVVEVGQRRRHRSAVAVGVFRLADVDAVAGGVEDLDRVVGHVDRLGEVQDDPVGGGVELLAGRRLGRQQLGVGLGSARDQHEREHGDRGRQEHGHGAATTEPRTGGPPGAVREGRWAGGGVPRPARRRVTPAAPRPTGAARGGPGPTAPRGRRARARGPPHARAARAPRRRRARRCPS